MKSATASANGNARMRRRSRWMPSRLERGQRLGHRGAGRAEPDDAGSRRASPRCSITGSGTSVLRGLELAQQPLHVVDVRRALLGVARVAVLGRAAREVAALASDACPDRCDTECRRRRRRDSGRSRVPASRSAAVITLPRSIRRAVVPRERLASASPACRCRGRASRRSASAAGRRGRTPAPRTRSTRVGSSGNSSTCLVSPCDA